MGYAVLQDVYDLGFTARAFVVAPRPVDPRAGDALVAATGIFRFAGHGFAADDVVEFLLIGAGSLPTAIAIATSYYPIPQDYFRFKLSASSGGAALTFAAAGSGWSLQINPERRLQRHIDDAAGRINECLTAYAAPLVPPYPAQIVGLNARLAARAAIPTLQFENATFRFAADRVLAMEAADTAMLDEWLAGKPINPEGADQDTIPNNAAFAAADREPTEWRTGAL